MTQRAAARAAGLLLSCLLLAPAWGASLQGQVQAADGSPIAGAIVSLTRGDGVLRESVYSDADGRFRLPTEQTGSARLSVRAPRHALVERSVELDAAGTTVEPLVLRPLTTAAQLSDALPASAHAATVRIEDGEIAKSYRSQCFYCHQIGNAWTRRPRSEEQWRETMARMERYGAFLTWGAEKQIVGALAQSFDGRPVADRQTHNYDAELARAKLTEVTVAGGLAFLHDVEVGLDGRLYSVDMANDIVYATELASGVSEATPMPDNGLPLHAALRGASAPVAAFNARHGPHSIVRGPDGRFYTTNAMSADIGVFDPGTRTYSFHAVGGGAIYPHTLRFDRQGVVWFSIALSNQLGRFDPNTGAMRVMDLPAGGFWQWLTDSTLAGVLKLAAWFPGKDLHLMLSHHRWSGQGHRILNLPYGLDISPLDDSVWYSKVYADRIGRFDPASGEIKEWPTPLPGPRRMRFAPDGMLWIPAFGGSALLKFDPRTEQFTTYPMPVLGAEEFETPYALNIHPDTGEVWITANMSDRMFRFIPKTGRWIAYPMSTRTTYMRDIVFTASGAVCSTNSNLPAPAIEGQLQAVVCLEPEALAAAAR